ncbi:MAG: ABC transporter permease [Prevotella sp.]|nr:ABC transporter permease [Prevotella sp.]
MELLNEIWQTTKRNRLRTALTGFAVAWGIFMLIVLLGAGNGLINAQMQNNSRFLDNSMMVGGGMTTKAYDGLKEGRRVTLNDADLETTARRFAENVDEVGAEMEQAGVTISLADRYLSCSLQGVYPNEPKINKIEMLHGRFINEQDNADRRKVLVVSDQQAKELYTGSVADLVGQHVKVDNFSFRIVGIYKGDRSRMQTNVYTPFHTVRTMYNRGDKADQIVFTFHGLESEQANADFEQHYRTAVNGNHRAAPDDEGATWIWNRFTQNLQMSKGMGILRTALWVIGIFTLLSGIVGVSNIMLITVKERTREFGIRKAIGAKPSAILKLIISESIIITTFFGYIGMLLGIAANLYMDATLGHQVIDTGLFQATMFVDPTVSIGICLQATLLMVVAGTIAGLIPARKAALIRPIEALRAE